MRAGPLVLVLAAGACAVSDDPSEGGFASGVAGLAGGGYRARVDTRAAAVAEAEARDAALTAELAALEGEHAALQRRVAALRTQLAARDVSLPAGTEARIERVLAGAPSPAGPVTDPAARAAALERAIADARQLAEQLAALAG